jgi:hypothetical protein
MYAKSTGTRHRTLATLVAACAVLAAGATPAPGYAKTATSGVSPKMVLDWNATAVATTLAAGASQPVAALYVGFAQAAVYDAVVAINGRFRPYLASPVVRRPASPDAAAATAAYRVLVTYFPLQKQMLDSAYAESLAAVPDGAKQDNGVSVGEQAAAALIAARTDDGRNAPGTYEPTPAPGVWRPTPPALLPALAPWLATTRPLLLNGPAQFRPGPPPALNSARYARDFDEARRYGAKNGSVRTAEQTEAALFWTENVPQQLNRTLRNLVVRLGLDLTDAARALVMGGTTMAEALIACWDAKYAYGAWRPITAIPAAGTDGNDRTTADPTWEPLLPTPNHPEYPSAHNCVTAALAATAVQLIGHEAIDLDVSSAVTGTSRQYRYVGDLEHDIVNARVWAGFHWRTSDKVGYQLGTDVATWALDRYFRPAA